MKIIGITGWSGSGKTTLLKALLPKIKAGGLRVSTVKHAHHDFDVDVEGKDSHTHRQAGAHEVLISSARRFALMHELRNEPEWHLAQLLSKLSPVDLVIIEGFKQEKHPKLEVFRASIAKAPLYGSVPNIRAIITDDPATLVKTQAAMSTPPLPILSLEAHDEIIESMLTFAMPQAEFIAAHNAKIMA